VIVYLWSAGAARGVTDTSRMARRYTAGCLRSRQADTALIEQAHFVPGIESMEVGYKRAARDPYWTGQRHASGRISWRMFVRELELAAS
jgi:hypothetical protein